MNIKIYSNDDVDTASYGILDRYKDVTEILKSTLKNNVETPILLSSNLFKFDPYFGKIKELNIKLKSNKLLKIKDNFYIEYIEIQELPPSIPELLYNNIDTVSNTILHSMITDILKKQTIVQYDYIVSTNARDENNILEWIVYHLLIGFERVVIIDHMSVRPIKQLIEPYHWKHRVDVIRNETQGNVKMMFLNKIIVPYMMKYCKKYFIHLDADEYIYIKDNMTIDKLLARYNNCNILALNWLMFGSNNLLTNNDTHKCLIPQFTKSDNTIHNHFKCLIKMNRNTNFSFINPHQILLKNTPSIYMNVSNKNVQYTGDIYKHMDSMVPIGSIRDLPCYINHYIVQSREDYINRKINRMRDDINAFRDMDENVFTQHNTLDNTNLSYYVDSIYYMLEKCRFHFGFIMIRHVNSTRTNEEWKNCYDSIRRFYNNMIVIIDDNSSSEFLTDHPTNNCIIVKSEYPKRGELLPYYYFIKNKYFDRAVVIHDSMKITNYYDFNNITNYKNFSRLFSFGNNAYVQDIHHFKDCCNYLRNGNLLYQYHTSNLNRMIGCFGVCYVVDHQYIVEIEKKYHITNLVNYIDSRPKRQTLERLLSCLFEMDKNNTRFDTRSDILGSIFNNNNSIIEKHFFGR
jgi:hypothetical protein